MRADKRSMRITYRIAEQTLAAECLCQTTPTRRPPYRVINDQSSAMMPRLMDTDLKNARIFFSKNKTTIGR